MTLIDAARNVVPRASVYRLAGSMKIARHLPRTHRTFPKYHLCEKAGSFSRAALSWNASKSSLPVVSNALEQFVHEAALAR